MAQSQCFQCKHNLGWNGVYRCRAFPDGIPDAFLYNRAPHTTPYPDKDGFAYEPLNLPLVSPLGSPWGGAGTTPWGGAMLMPWGIWPWMMFGGGHHGYGQDPFTGQDAGGDAGAGGSADT